VGGRLWRPPEIPARSLDFNRGESIGSHGCEGEGPGHRPRRWASITSADQDKIEEIPLGHRTGNTQRTTVLRNEGENVRTLEGKYQGVSALASLLVRPTLHPAPPTAEVMQTIQKNQTTSLPRGRGSARLIASSILGPQKAASSASAEMGPRMRTQRGVPLALTRAQRRGNHPIRGENAPRPSESTIESKVERELYVLPQTEA